MRLDFWQALGIVSGALVALFTLIGLVYRWVMRPVWRTIRRLNLLADDLLGDRTRGIPSLTQRLQTQTEQTAHLANRLDEHLSWHSGGGRSRANGPRPVPAPPVNQQ